MDATSPNHFADSAQTQRLLTQVSAGDRHAFNDLFNRHRRELRQAVELRLDRRLRARVDASDIVQEAQMEAFRRFDVYLKRRPMPFLLWLRKTAQERIYNHRRAHVAATRRSVLREESVPDESSMRIVNSLIGHSSSPSRGVIRREYHRLVNEAVDELDDVDREILLMRNVEGLAQSEIAQVLDLSHGTVRKRYGRALVKLQRSLATKGLTEGEP